MLKLKAAFAGLALAVVVGVAGAASGQQRTGDTAAQSQAVPCTSNRSSAQEDPNRRDWNVSVGEDDGNDDWMTRQQVARIVLYDPANFRGRRVGVTQDTPDLGAREFSDTASSVRVYHGVWELCEEPNYGGMCRCFSSHANVNRFGMGNPVTDISLEAEGFGDRVSSIRLVRSRP